MEGPNVRLLRFWFTLEGTVDRRTYFFSGIGLALVKYFGDASLIALTTGILWKPTDYLVTVHSLMEFKLPGSPEWLIPALGLWTIPFLWIGVTLTLRRALDADLSEWLTLAFFVPYLNYVLMASLCLVPSSGRAAQVREVRERQGRLLSSAALAISAGLVFAISMVALSVLFKGHYGSALFFGTPFAMGALTAFIFNCRYPATTFETIQVTMSLFIFVGGALFLLAFEGAVCIFMAVPIGLIVGILGAMMGRTIALTGRRTIPPAITAMLLLPLWTILEPPHMNGRILHEVQSSIEIDASPAFRPISESPDLLSRLGVAYPEYARIEGSGVGAVRYCVFSTGPFVEPIARWEPESRLGFDVKTSPDPLRELSIYKSLSPSHLHGYLRSRRGEFRLIALPGARTRLEGSTWYEIEMAPEGYWQVWSDFLIHRIHERVLNHIKFETEGE
jgi:hypothetical protein